VRINVKEVPDNIRRWMSSEDQAALFVHPRADAVPPMKTDKAEREEQRHFANYCLLHQYPFVWHATNTRSKATPGTPDFWVGVNRCGLWIEFKRDYSCKLSEQQEDFARKLERQGMKLYVVYSCNEAMELVSGFEGVYVQLSI
jgi:hypothetical protein